LSPGERAARVREALAQAEQLRQARRFKEGIDLLVEALRYGVDKAQVYFRLGNLYFDAGDLDRAEYAYGRAVQEDPRHASAHHNLGVVYRKQGRISASVKMLKKARSLELRYPPKVEVNEGQRRFLKALAWRLTLIPLGFLVAVLLLLWIVGRFFR